MKNRPLTKRENVKAHNSSSYKEEEVYKKSLVFFCKGTRNINPGNYKNGQ